MKKSNNRWDKIWAITIAEMIEEIKLEGKRNNFIQHEQPRKYWRQYPVCLKL